MSFSGWVAKCCRGTHWRQAKASHAVRNRFKAALVEKIPLFEGLSTRELNQIARLVNEFEPPQEHDSQRWANPVAKCLLLLKARRR